MKDIFSAMVEGALLTKAGVPPREMIEHISEAYKDTPSVSALFEELKDDWDHPAPDQEYKMLAPFKKRETTKPDFLIASTFAEMAAMTDMLEGFWKNAGLIYVLKNHVMQTRAKQNDLKLARDLIGFMPPETPLIDYLFALAPETEWSARNFYASQASISFVEWVKATWPKMAPPAPLRTRKAIEAACLKSKNLELIAELQTEWDQFASLLAADSSSAS